MTQVKSAQVRRAQVASTPRATGRTLAQRRADFEAQVHSYVDRNMALSKSELPDVSHRLKDLRDELARVREVKEVPQYIVAGEIDVPPRTFQSWENGEVEPRGEGYGPLADYYSGALGRTITKNWIMFGQEDPPADPELPQDDLDEISGAGVLVRLDRIEQALLELRTDVADLGVQLAKSKAPARRSPRSKPA